MDVTNVNCISTAYVEYSKPLPLHERVAELVGCAMCVIVPHSSSTPCPSTHRPSCQHMETQALSPNGETNHNCQCNHNCQTQTSPFSSEPVPPSSDGTSETTSVILGPLTIRPRSRLAKCAAAVLCVLIGVSWLALLFAQVYSDTR